MEGDSNPVPMPTPFTLPALLKPDVRQKADHNMAKRKRKVGAKATGNGPPSPVAKRSKVSQTEFPRYSLDQVMRIPQALWDEFAGKGAAPHDVAIALDLAPTSGNWRLLCGGSIAYGLTEGGYNATRYKPYKMI